MLTKKAARELAPENIRVNAIGPGFIETHMTTIFEIAPPERVEETLKSVPMGRRGLPIEVANAYYRRMTSNCTNIYYNG